MSGVYIKSTEMPKNCMLCSFCVEEADPANGEMCLVTGKLMPPCNRERLDNCPLVPVPDHGRLIDADALRAKMYHEAFETDTPMQKWDSGCWIRYKLFEMTEESAPTIIPADKEGEG